MTSLFSPRPILAGARGRLLMFNLLVVAVTLMVSGVAIVGFRHAGNLQEQMQAHTLSEMTGSMELGRDTANVAIAAIRLSQVVGALEYQSEALLLAQTQLALQDSLRQLAQSPLAASEPALVERITRRSGALEASVTRLLELGRQRHMQRNQLLSELYQCQMYLHQIATIAARERQLAPTFALREEIDRLLDIAIHTTSPRSALIQLDQVMAGWPPADHLSPLLADKIRRFMLSQQNLGPLGRELSDSDLAIAYFTYHIKALVGMLNGDINLYVQKVAGESRERIRQTHHELASIIYFIGLFALLSLVITLFAGWYIYRNLGSNLSVIADAMSRLAGGERQVSVPGLHRRDELGDLARAFNVFAGNTASLEQTSRLLKEKSTQLENTFLAMRDGFALFDRRGRLVVWNPQYPLLLGLPATLLFRGQHYRELLAALGRNQAKVPGYRDWREVNAHLRALAPRALELHLAAGPILELRFSPVPRHGMVNVVLDRSERKALEQALVHSQKMKAVGQLTGGLAHDFNNLLAVIIGSLELCANGDGRDGERIDRALKAAGRGAQLTQRLLAFSRKQALHPQAVQLPGLVDNLSVLLRQTLPVNLILKVAPQLPGWFAWIDVNQLENAIMNLVVNARDAMEGRGGEIIIRTYNQRVVRAGGRKQDMVTLEVGDSGCGMSAEVQSQVFEPFFTTKTVGNGSGLGLSMVYGFIRQSGGRVQIESSPGAGTLVRLQLPRAPAMDPAPEPMPDPGPAAREDLLVLVLDDQEDVRDTLCEQLHQLGYVTLAAGDSAEALMLLGRTPDIAMLISDLMLPGARSGAEVIQLARQANPALATLLISGQDMRRDGCGLPDAVTLLRKPFTLAQLAQALRQSLGMRIRSPV
ncbi:ATP-binding protein [Acerihabitans sp.]|uniref:ATP-binding protein n=1 Tax=Acerihabitans sp. TaxID=2811394 RepID=UPI002ED859AB